MLNLIESHTDFWEIENCSQFSAYYLGRMLGDEDICWGSSHHPNWQLHIQNTTISHGFLFVPISTPIQNQLRNQEEVLLDNIFAKSGSLTPQNQSRSVPSCKHVHRQNEPILNIIYNHPQYSDLNHKCSLCPTAQPEISQKQYTKDNTRSAHHTKQRNPTNPTPNQPA